MTLIKGKQLDTETITDREVSTTTPLTTAVLDVSGGSLATINAGDAATEGVGSGVSRRDHQHGVATAAAGTVSIGDAAAEGVASDLARADHAHAVPAPAAPANVTKSAAATGVATEGARADHKHDVTTATAIELTDSTNAEGASASLARADHTHGHGVRGGGTQHADATTGVAGFLSAADKTKLDALIDPRFRDFKESVRIKSAADVATLSGNQTVDSVVTAPGDRVSLFSQTTTAENGIYVTAAGAWSRADDFQAGDAAAGAFFAVEEGTAAGDTTWLVTNNQPNDVIGTDPLAVVQIGSGSPRGDGAGLLLSGNTLNVGAHADGSMTVNADDVQVGILATDAQHGVRGGGTQHADAIAAGASGFMTGADKTKIDSVESGATAETSNQESVTTQSINNSDTALTDTLNASPKTAASLLLFLNGVMLRQGAGNDYSVSGTTITWLASSGTASNLSVNDRLDAYYVS